MKKSKLKNEMCKQLIGGGYLKLYDTIRHSYTRNRMSVRNKQDCVQSENGICPTLDTRCDCIGVVVPDETQDKT